MIGSVRVVNKRWDANVKAEEDEVVIDIDRPSGSPLQNHHPMQSKDARERQRVIGLNKHDLEVDLAQKGVRYTELKRIAAIVAEGSDVALQCWCAPQPCHGDDYVPIIKSMAEIMVSEQSILESAPACLHA